MNSMAFAGHFRLYDFVWKDAAFSKLKPIDKMVFISLAHQAPRAFPSINTLAKKNNCHRVTVMRSLKRLVLSGLIGVMQKRGYVNHYYVSKKFLPAKIVKKMKDHAEHIIGVLNYKLNTAYGKVFDAPRSNIVNGVPVTDSAHKPNSSINQTNSGMNFFEFLKQNPEAASAWNGYERMVCAQ